MKYLKKYEEKNSPNQLFDIGDYVAIRFSDYDYNRPESVRQFLLHNAGQIKKIKNGFILSHDIIYLVKYNDPDNIITRYTNNDNLFIIEQKDLRLATKEEIEKIETDIDVEKYNM